MIMLETKLNRKIRSKINLPKMVTPLMIVKKLRDAVHKVSDIIQNCTGQH